jgi:hypothetical protein
MNCGPLSEMTGTAPEGTSFAPCKMISMSASVIESEISQFTTYRLRHQDAARVVNVPPIFK